MATGVRVRMNMPDGLVYLVGSAQLDGDPLEDERGNCPFLSSNGAHIGDVAPGEERCAGIAYSVAGAIENGTVVELQAAVAAFEISPVGSNIARFVVRSHPVLANALTNVDIESRSHQARPGGEAVITLRVHNAGESSAHDVVVLAPIPDHTVYIANSARVNGREIEAELRAPFDRIYAPVIVRSLPASATATLTYRVRIDDPLDDGTAIVVKAGIGSHEAPAFELPPATLAIASAPEFRDDQNACSIEPAREVQPGELLTMRLKLHNSGTMAAQNVSAAVYVPEGLLLVRGASRLDGLPVKEKHKKESVALELGRVDARSSVELSVAAMVASPVQNGTVLRPAFELQWSPGTQTRRMEPEIRVISQPFFSMARNSIERVSAATVRPGHEVEALITLRNDGSAAATDAVLEVQSDPAIEDLVLLEKNAKVVLADDAAEIGQLDPYATRRFTVRGRVRSPFRDGAELKLAASLHSLELGQTQLGAAIYRVDSHPAFSAGRCTLSLMSAQALRPNEVADAYVQIVNDGTDTAQDVRLRLYISAEARLDSVDGATREKSTIVFGQIPSGASVEARLGLRLLRSLAREYPVTVDAILTATSILPVPLQPLTIVTTAEPDFSVGLLQSRPADFVDAGETVEYALHVRNGGDGAARKVEIRIDSSPALIYVPNTTTVNGVPIRDVGAAAPFAGAPGIILKDVDPGIEAVVVWREVVHSGSAAGESIARVASVSYQGNRHDEIRAPELQVRSSPAFANNVPGLPFGLDGMVGYLLAPGSQRALSDSGARYLELPPATPVTPAENGASVGQFASPTYLSLESGSATNGDVAAATIDSVLEISPEALARSLKFLEQAHFRPCPASFRGSRFLGHRRGRAFGIECCASGGTRRSARHFGSAVH